MTKRTWKGRNISAERIREAVHTSRNYAEAARQLGVNRSTLYRWIQADESLKERRHQETHEAVESAEGLTADGWAQHIEQTYPLESTERVLVDLARRALMIARDEDEPASARVSAMGRFQRLVAQLRLEERAKKGGEQAKSAESAARQKRPERQSDPRSILRAVN